jgi:hypothetical protein
MAGTNSNKLKTKQNTEVIDLNQSKEGEKVIQSLEI